MVATNDLKCLHSIDLYAKRWEKKLIVIFSIAFCWCYKIGIKQHNEKPITIKNHGRASKSLFRLGLDFFQENFRAIVVFAKHDYFDWLVGFLMIDINTIPLISKDN